jgi:hypothetical protein
LESQQKKVRVPLLGEAGLILSKTKSVRLVKRPRDAFDIYYVATGPNGAQAAKTIQTLTLEFDEIAEQVKEFRSWLSSPKNSGAFNRNVRKYSKIENGDPAHAVLQRLSQGAG